MVYGNGPYPLTPSGAKSALLRVRATLITPLTLFSPRLFLSTISAAILFLCCPPRATFRTISPFPRSSSFLPRESRDDLANLPDR